MGPEWVQLFTTRSGLNSSRPLRMKRAASWVLVVCFLSWLKTDEDILAVGWRGAWGAAALLVCVCVFKAGRLLQLGGLFLLKPKNIRPDVTEKLLTTLQRMCPSGAFSLKWSTWKSTLRLEKLPMKERPERLLLLGWASSVVSVLSSLLPWWQKKHHSIFAATKCVAIKAEHRNQTSAASCY